MGPGSAPRHCVPRRVRDTKGSCAARTRDSRRLNSLVPRTRRSALRGATLSRGPPPQMKMGPGSAPRHYVPRRVRDTKGSCAARMRDSGRLSSLVPRTRRSALRDAPLSRGPPSQMKMGPGSAPRHCVPRRVRDTAQKLRSSVRSRQSGLSFSISAIFQARRHRFIECSRARASRIDSNASK
jgi:hypothetical protein